MPPAAGVSRNPLAAAAVLVGACVVRYLYWQRVGHPIVGVDSPTYLGLAQSVAKGDLSGFARLPFYALYPVTLAPMHWLAIPQAEYIKWLHVGASSITVYLLYRIGVQTVSRPFGLALAGVAAVYPLFLFWLPYILTETLFLCCLAAYASVLLLAIDERRQPPWIGFGVLCVIFLASRPSATPCVVFTAVLLACRVAQRRWGAARGTAAVVLGVGLSVALATAAIAASPALRARILSMPTIGQTLWASTKYSTGNLKELRAFEELDQSVHTKFRGRPERDEYAWKFQESTQFIVSHPAAYARIVGHKMLAYWFPWWFADSWSMGHRALDAAVSLALSLGFVLCLVRRPIGAWPMAAFITMAAAFALPSAFGQIDPDGRYRLPAELITLVPATAGYWSLIKSPRIQGPEGRRRSGSTRTS